MWRKKKPRTLFTVLYRYDHSFCQIDISSRAWYRLSFTILLTTTKWMYFFFSFCFYWVFKVHKAIKVTYACIFFRFASMILIFKEAKVITWTWIYFSLAFYWDFMFIWIVLWSGHWSNERRYLSNHFIFLQETKILKNCTVITSKSVVHLSSHLILMIGIVMHQLVKSLPVKIYSDPTLIESWWSF